MRLDPLYRVTFATPESWSVELAGNTGTESQKFLLAEGRSSGRLSARFRAANYPRQRVDDTLLPDFRGALETDDGATILFSWSGYARSGAGARESWWARSPTSRTTSATPGSTPPTALSPARSGRGRTRRASTSCSRSPSSCGSRSAQPDPTGSDEVSEGSFVRSRESHTRSSNGIPSIVIASG